MKSYIVLLLAFAALALATEPPRPVISDFSNFDSFKKALYKWAIFAGILLPKHPMITGGRCASGTIGRSTEWRQLAVIWQQGWRLRGNRNS